MHTDFHFATIMTILWDNARREPVPIPATRPTLGEWLTDSEIDVLRAGLDRALGLIPAFDELFQLFVNMPDLRGQPVPGLTESLLARMIGNGLEGLTREQVIQLATTPEWLAELKDAIDANPSARWLGGSDAVISNDRIATPARNNPAIGPRPSSELGLPSIAIPFRDHRPVDIAGQQSTSPPGEVVSERTTKWIIPVSADGIECYSGTPPDSLAVELTLSGVGDGVRLEVEFDPLPMTQDVECRGRLVSAARRELAQAGVEARKLTFPLPNPNALTDTVLECEYRDANSYFRFRVGIARPIGYVPPDTD
jgi:hypothetical protein